MLTSKQPFKLIFFLVKVFGFQSKILGFKLKVLSFSIFLLLTTFPTLLLIAKVLTSDDRNIIFLSIMQIIPAYTQIQIKSFLFLWNFKSFQRFFKTLCFVFSVKVVESSTTEFKRMETIIKVFGCFILLSSLIGVLPPLITRKLTIEMWEPETSHKTAIFLIYWVLQSASSVYCVTLMFIFDSLSLSSIILIQAYAKYLRKVFSSGKFSKLNGKSMIVEKVKLHLSLKK